MNASHLRTLVIRPTLTHLKMWSPEAEDLVLGTACAESHCGEYLKQIQGPALGIYQMEPQTHIDLHQNYLAYRPELQKLLMELSCPRYAGNAYEQTGNLFYATAMCRLHYYRQPEAIPRTLEGQADYWKNHYNSHLGKGTVEKYLEAWDALV